MNNQITITRGDDRELELTLTDGGGAPIDLTGASLWFTVENLFQKTLADGIAVSAPLTGVAIISIEAGDTSGSPDRRVAYPYDVQVRTSLGKTKTPIRGVLVVKPDITED
jgi:hypothetical protein